MDFSLVNKKGYTLIELIIVILIVIIFSAVAYIKWINSPAITLYAQTDLLADDIRYAQNLSMSRGQHFQIVFTTPNSYQILDASNNVVTLPSGNATSYLSSGVGFGSINIPDSSTKIVFDGLGRPYSSETATTPITSNATIQLITGSQIRTITINSETGSVSVS